MEGRNRDNQRALKFVITLPLAFSLAASHRYVPHLNQTVLRSLMDSPTSGPWRRNPASPPNWRRINKKSSTTIFSSLARPTTPESAKRRSRVRPRDGWREDWQEDWRYGWREDKGEGWHGMGRRNEVKWLKPTHEIRFVHTRRWWNDIRYHGGQTILAVSGKRSLQSLHAGNILPSLRSEL